MQIAQHLSKDLLIVTKAKFYIQAPIYAFFLLWISVFGVREIQPFIYFQF